MAPGSARSRTPAHGCRARCGAARGSHVVTAGLEGCLRCQRAFRGTAAAAKGCCSSSFWAPQPSRRPLKIDSLARGSIRLSPPVLYCHAAPHVSFGPAFLVAGLLAEPPTRTSLGRRIVCRSQPPRHGRGTAIAISHCQRTRAARAEARRPTKPQGALSPRGSTTCLPKLPVTTPLIGLPEVIAPHLRQNSGALDAQPIPRILIRLLGQGEI